MSATSSGPVQGHVEPGFGPVADAFAANFAGGTETGAACAVYVDGRPVVDLYGGLADKATGRTWTADTATVMFSVSKAMLALCAHVAAQRGLLDFDAPVATLWPEYAAHGKDATTVRDVFAHRAGLMALDADLTLADVVAWEPVIRAIEAQRPLYAPGSAFAYHPLTFGWLAGEILRRATGRLPGDLLADWITGPLGADGWIGLPEGSGADVATLYPPTPWPLQVAWRLVPHYLRLRGLPGMVRSITLGSAIPFHFLEDGHADFNSPTVHAAQIPAANGIFSARGLGRAFAAAVAPLPDATEPDATEPDGTLPDAKPVTYPLLTEATIADAVAVRSAGDGWPNWLHAPGIRFGTGFMVDGIPYRPMLSPTSFGHDGASGCLGFADAEHRLGFGYVNNRFGPVRDERAKRLVLALRGCLGLPPPADGPTPARSA